MQKRKPKGGYHPAKARQEILSQIDMRDILDHYGISYEQGKGKGVSCLCPFHDDHRPSMNIFAEKGSENLVFYKCFSCGEGGDLFKFVTKYEEKYNHRKLNHVQTMHHIVRMLGLDPEILPHVENRKGSRENPEKTEGRALAEKFQRAAEMRRYTEEGKQAIDRIIPDDRTGIADEFHIGYWENDAHRWEEFVKQSGHTLDDCRKIGLVFSKGGRWIMPYAGKVVIPLTDRFGKVISFIGRSDDSKTGQPKYVMPFRTIYGHIRTNLFNYHRALPYMENGRVYVFEGVENVLNAQKLEMKNSVATLGTGLTKTQIRLLKQDAVMPVMVFDRETAVDERIHALLFMKEQKMPGLVLELERLPSAFQGCSSIRELAAAGCSQKDLDLCVVEAEEYLLQQFVERGIGPEEKDPHRVADFVRKLNGSGVIQTDREFIRCCELIGTKAGYPLDEVMEMAENTDSYVSRKEQESRLTGPEELREIDIDRIAESLHQMQKQDPKALERTMGKLHTVYTCAFGDEKEMEL
ncbi:CHC2 zinc finger domain-containing protein [Faecalibaculum rodentium]|uniref:CHC2 zinc finger domain-containing protein n=1 Tax=Faecalibaculum rodentium TaxID=1702221 RepID=UPI0023F36AB0|nr:CHC2 zinc finger domain-containing protein [Faecalibaculum rodentium]